MPSIDASFLGQLRDDYTRYPVFVETGTLAGDTVFAMEPLFDRLYTIEIKEEYYCSTQQRYLEAIAASVEPRKTKIQFLLGDSSSVLPDILPQLDTNCIFFLDGHWSAGDTGKGDKDCPLMEEFAAIRDHCAHEAIIIVDDCRMFGVGPTLSDARFNLCDWEDIHLEPLLAVLQSRITQTYFLDSSFAANDRLIIHIRANA